MTIIETIKPYVEAGFSIHWLRARSKAPVESAWSSVPRKTFDQLKSDYRDDMNVGVRLGEYSRVGGGFLHVIDLDIRVDEQVEVALARLRELIPSYNDLPFVISGSGGESRHFYFVTDKHFRSKKLAKSEGFSMVFDQTKGRPVKKHDWEIELFGTSKQVAMPPSVHPDTGAEYAWGREFDWAMLDLGIGPHIASGEIEGLAGVADENTGEIDGRPPIGLTIEQAKHHLDGLPVEEWCNDRDNWYQVGMALHHEFSGRGLEGAAFELWCQWSAQDDKFEINDARRVWVSFKDNKQRNIRMASIMQAARFARFDEKLGGLLEGDDGFDEPAKEPAKSSVDDLLGTPESASLNASGERQSSASVDDLLGTPAKEIDPMDDLVAKGKPAAAGSEWMQKLDFNDDGAIRPTLPNVRLIVANDVRIRGVIAYNEFSEGIVRMGDPGKLVKKRDGAQGTKQLAGNIWKRRDLVNGDLWRDVHDHAVRDLVETPGRMGGYSVKVSDRDLNASISMAAADNLFHPVRKYLDEQTWDGTERLDTLFIRYFGSPDNAYSRAVGRLMMIGGVSRIYEPGHKFDFAVILEGMQGKRKTTFIETLAKNWFGELASEFDNTNKMIESMQNAWIIEIPELSGFSKHDVQAIKAFISRRTDRARLAWAKRPQDYHRQCIFIGSTNDSKYLRDDTGGRRFWPVECLLDDNDDIDIEGLTKEVDQLWAEAKHLYLEMRKAQPRGILPLYLADHEAAIEAKRMQETRRVETVEDSMAGQIEGWLDQEISLGDGFEGEEKLVRNVTCLKMLWIEALGNDPRSFNAQAAQTVGRAMRLVKMWEGRSNMKRDFVKYGRQRAYFRKATMTDVINGRIEEVA